MIRKFQSCRGEVSVFIVLAVIFVGAVTMVGGLLPGEKEPKPKIADSDRVTIENNVSGPAQKNIQLKSLSYVTTAPVPPSPTGPRVPCPLDNGIPAEENCICQWMKIECKDRKCVRIISIRGKFYQGSNTCNADPALAKLYCESKVHTPADGIYCLAKPVIYLYPTEKTLVDVSVKTEGKIVVSDPLYPAGGWKNVTAYPSGKLIYQGKEYQELFYESETEELNPLKEGFIIRRENIDETLRSLNKKLGLNDWESKELRDFWTPRLEAVSSQYLFVSLIQGEEKDRIDEINITPKPDTMIEVLYYFKPVEKAYKAPALVLPKTPKRFGFTAVEWGGTLDTKSIK